MKNTRNSRLPFLLVHLWRQFRCVKDTHSLLQSDSGALSFCYWPVDFPCCLALVCWLGSRTASNISYTIIISDGYSAPKRWFYWSYKGLQTSPGALLMVERQALPLQLIGEKRLSRTSCHGALGITTHSAHTHLPWQHTLTWEAERGCGSSFSPG
jgi:hypothetical protein